MFNGETKSVYSTQINEVTQLAEDLWLINEAGSVNCYLLLGETSSPDRCRMGV